MGTQKLKMLWIGGNKSVANDFERHLKKSGENLLDIVLVANIKIALNSLSSDSFNAVFIDTKGPSQGDEWWKAFEELSHALPVILVTEGDDEDFVFSALRKGATDFIHVKDASASSILKTLRHALHSFGLQKALSESKKSEELLSILAKQGSGFLWTTDSNLLCRSLSGPALEKLGLHEEQIVGQSIFALVQDESEKTKLENAHKQALTGEPKTVQFSMLSSRFQAQIEAQRNPTGEVTGVLGVAVDITQRAAFEDQFLAAQKMESVGRLALGVAHDFNNLLTVILNYSQMVLVKAKDDETLRNRMEAISNCAHRAASITSQFLAFGRRHRPKPQGVSISSVLSIVEPMLRQAVGGTIDLKILEEETGLQVFMDPNHLMHVVMSMVQSAQESMPEGGALTLQTSNRVVDEESGNQLGGMLPGDYVVISVKDNGRGFDAESAEHIFELFGGEKSEGGAPVSLSAINGMVKHAGGHIQVKSELGKGSCFDIYLPRYIDQPAIVEEKKATVPEKSLETILVVDDEELVRRIVVDVMKQGGYNVIEASSAIEALKICEQRQDRVDLVLTDLIMPKMNGPELVRKMAAKNPHVRVVYMSGYTDDAVDHIEALETKESFVQKPFVPKSLLGAVKDALGRSPSLSS